MTTDDVNMILERFNKFEEKFDKYAEKIDHILLGNGEVGICEQTRNNSEQIEEIRLGIVGAKNMTLKLREDTTKQMQDFTKNSGTKMFLEVKNWFYWLKKTGIAIYHIAKWITISLGPIFVVSLIIFVAKHPNAKDAKAILDILMKIILQN